MNERVPLRISTVTRSQRIVLVLAGILVALGIAEAGMRIVGFALQAPQERRNQATPRSSASSEDIRILALGESTTAAYFVAGDATDWPKQLERILNERRPDKRFTVYNEGIGGTNTAFILDALNGNLERIRPDWVITMMGVNDDPWMTRLDGSPASRLGLWFKDFRVVKLVRHVLRMLVEPEPRLSAPPTPSDPSPPPTIQPGSPEAPSPMDCFRTPRSLTEEAHRAVIAPGVDALGEGRVAEGEAIFRDALARYPESSLIHAELGRLYQNLQRKADSLAELQRAHELDPDSCPVLVNLGVALSLNERWAACVDLLMRAETLASASTSERVAEVIPRIRIGLTQCRAKLEAKRNEDDDDRSARPEAFLPYEATAHHYRELARRLADRGVHYAAMQYPTMDVDILKRLLGEDGKGVLFIENRKHFAERCAGEHYEECFSDRIRPSFGHTTALGHRLIAEQAADAILKQLDEP